MLNKEFFGMRAVGRLLSFGMALVFYTNNHQIFTNILDAQIFPHTDEVKKSSSNRRNTANTIKIQANWNQKKRCSSKWKRENRFSFLQMFTFQLSLLSFISILRYRAKQTPNLYEYMFERKKEATIKLIGSSNKMAIVDWVGFLN